MLSAPKVSTIDHWRGIGLIPLILFLAIMLALASPGQSQSAEKQLIKPHMDVSQRIAEESENGKVATKGTKKSLYQKMIGNLKRLVAFPKLSRSVNKQLIDKDSEEAVLSESEERLYEQVNAILEYQKRIESINKELTEQLSLKNDIIASLEYSEQILWNKLEANEKKFWDALTAKDKEYQKAEELTDQLALKDSVIKTLKGHKEALEAQLEDNKRTFEIALAAIDPEYKPTEERAALIPESLFGYSPPSTQESSLESKNYGAYDRNSNWYTDAVATNTADEDHPWGSLVCITCHEGSPHYNNEVNISVKIPEFSKNILWKDNINVSEYMISDSLPSDQEIANNYSNSDNLKGDSISTFKSWTSPPSDIITCNDQDPHIVCSRDSKKDSWWHWFNQKISTFKTSVAETVYSYL